MPDERWDAREGIKEGIKAGIGILGALKEALEETFEEAMKERDFGPDRARDAFRETVRRAQETMDQARDRFDFVPRKDFEALQAQVDALRRQIELHLTNAVHHTHGAGTGGAAGAGAWADSAPGGYASGELHTHPASGPGASPSDSGGLAGEDRPRTIPLDEGE